MSAPRGGGGYNFEMQVPFTPIVKWLIVANVSIWVVFQLILERNVLDSWVFTQFGALIPHEILYHFQVWRVATYMFLHSENLFHVVFNMLLLWWLGGSLEQRWGSRFFLSYYFGSGMGAAVLYTLTMLFYGLFTGNDIALKTPVVGASGAVFGLLIAYGIIFGERTVLFFMLFPMKAKWFVAILGAMEVVSLLNSGIAGSQVANLAHIGGLVSGFLFLQFYTRFQQHKWRRKAAKRGRGLRLVVNNDKEKEDDKDGPRYWN